MKMKHIIWIITGIVAVISMAAGIAVLVDRYLRPASGKQNYIECDCEPEAE